MELDQIRAMPTSIDNPAWRGGCGRDPKCYRCWQCEKEARASGRGWHESLLRSYQVLKKAEAWLEAGTPGNVVLEMIRWSYADRFVVHNPTAPIRVSLQGPFGPPIETTMTQEELQAIGTASVEPF